MSFNDNHIEPSSLATVRRLPIEFTGSGSEYFRIWIVNLLLLLVTLGLYWPWAKVRRQRYFWGNTLVDGDPLGFHGDPKQMFKGWALVAVLFAMYNVASNASAVASLVAFIALAALWPALWRSSIRFRMANTSWRGLRFRFVGSMRDAYLSLLPLFLMALPLVVVSMWAPEEAGQEPPVWFGYAMGPALVLVLLTLPWTYWRMKAYQHQHYALGPLQTDFRAPLRSFFMLALKPFLLLLGFSALIGLLIAISVWGTDYLRENMPWFLRLIPLFLLGSWLFMFVGIGPWFTTRLQNLVWTKTGNGQMRFISQLRFRDMFWLSLKNALLIGITLGLYWPFAKVAMARLRLEAVHVRTVTDMQALLAAGHDRPAEAAGDAAGDFFGLDVGL